MSSFFFNVVHALIFPLVARVNRWNDYHISHGRLRLRPRPARMRQTRQNSLARAAEPNKNAKCVKRTCLLCFRLGLLGGAGSPHS